MAKNKKFKLHLVGEGDGCDYTIGCNHSLQDLKATSLEEAKKEVAEILENDGALDSEEGIEKATIYEIASETAFDVQVWLASRDDDTDEDEKIDDLDLTENQERKLLEKLKNKYSPEKAKGDADEEEDNDED